MPEQSDERFSNTYYHSPEHAFDNKFKRYLIRRVEPFVLGPDVLELGYLDGMWTDRLLELGHSVDIVEGSSRRCEAAMERYRADPRVRVHRSMFEDFHPGGRFDTVLAGDMLQFVDHPPTFLRAASAWTAPAGNLLITVPNSRSLHRRIGALMGMEASPDELHSNDAALGGRHAFEHYSLHRLLRECGYNVDFIRGSFLKPLSSSQMTGWSDELFEAFDRIGDELQPYCYYLYARARPYGC